MCEVHRYVNDSGSRNAREKSKLIKAKPQASAHWRIKTLSLAARVMFYQNIKPQLPAQHAQHKLVTERTIICAHLSVIRRKKHSGIRALFLDATKDIESRQTRSRYCTRASTAPGANLFHLA